jgi:hypothetical protein
MQDNDILTIFDICIIPSLEDGMMQKASPKLDFCLRTGQSATGKVEFSEISKIGKAGVHRKDTICTDMSY